MDPTEYLSLPLRETSNGRLAGTLRIQTGAGRYIFLQSIVNVRYGWEHEKFNIEIRIITKLTRLLPNNRKHV
jgi:hypothetical protein